MYVNDVYSRLLAEIKKQELGIIFNFLSIFWYVFFFFTYCGQLYV